jgi:mono/diheme cytochrome c family protein
MLSLSRLSTAVPTCGALLLGVSVGQALGQNLPASARARTLSAFEMQKAERLVRDKLPCLGCHELGGEGGRIGPSLSQLQVTRDPDYVFSMIRNPQGTIPGTVMPRVPMAEQYLWVGERFGFQIGLERDEQVLEEESLVKESMLELIANFLLQREPSSDAPPTQLPRSGPIAEDETDGETLYQHYCASCHGTEGAADGPNAERLAVQPVSHADAEYMSARPDDSLFDAIYSGGYIMNLSHLMPPYGRTLSREQIWSLVRYLRELCDCQGPAWSRDNKR